MPSSQKIVTLTDIRIVKIADGDSFTAVINDRQSPCRLFGIDAPELGQRFGTAARMTLASLIAGRTLRGRIVTLDCYNRLVIDLWAFSTLRIGILMLRSGMSWHTPRWSPDRHKFSQAMTWARAGRIGLWFDPHPVPPWTWRRLQGHRNIAMRTSRRDRIKRP
jgi:endonuclease YncB( thermonuclease family)